MVKRAQDLTTNYNENMRGGDGVVEITGFATPAELNEKGRLFCVFMKV